MGAVDSFGSRRGVQAGWGRAASSAHESGAIRGSVMTTAPRTWPSVWLEEIDASPADLAAELLAAARASLLPMAEANERLSRLSNGPGRERRLAAELRAARERLTAAVHATEDSRPGLDNQPRR